MLNISKQKLVSLLLCISSFSISFSCARSKASDSTPSAEVAYKTFTEPTNYYIDFLPPGIDNDTDYDSVFKIDIRNDKLENWQYWNRDLTSISIGWALWCSNEEGADFVITSGAIEFKRNSTPIPSIETHDLRFTRASIDDGRCQGRQVYIQFGGPQYLSDGAQDFLPVAFFNARDEVVRKGRYPEGVVRRIKYQLPEKIVEIAKVHSAMLKASGTKRDIFCTIQSYTDPLLQGSALELTHIFENQFESIEDQSIDCIAPLEIRRQISECQNNTSTDIVFCIVYEKYKQTSSWLTASLQLLREISQENTLSVEAAGARDEALKEIESKLNTFGS